MCTLILLHYILIYMVCAVLQAYFVEIIFRPLNSVGSKIETLDTKCLLLFHTKLDTFWSNAIIHDLLNG